MAEQTPEQLQAALVAANETIEKLNAEVRALRAAQGEDIPEELAALVKEKRAAGLDLKTALEAARNQIAHDKALAAEAKKAKKSKE